MAALSPIVRIPSPLTRARFLAALLLSLVAAAVPAKEVIDRDWIEVRTPNFTVRSAQSESDTVELARSLELFKVAVSILTNVSDTEAAIPTKIVAFRSRGDAARAGLDDNFAGLFAPSLRENSIIIRETRGAQETEIILHEYVHFLVRNHGKHNYPKWFDEGFAEYLSSSRVTRSEFKVGLPLERRRGNLVYSNWIPMRRILSAEDYANWSREGQSMFYAEAWALVHFMLNRKDHDRPFGEDMGRYLELLETGTGHEEAFAAAFGIDSSRLNRDVKRYLKKGKFAYFSLPIDMLLPDFDYAVDTLPREQVALTLADVALRLGELDNADRWYAIAAEHEVTRAQALAGRGDVRKFQDEFDAALPFFTESIELAPDDPLCQLDMAEYWHDLARATATREERADYYERAREHYVAAWKLDDQKPEPYAMYGLTMLEEGGRLDKAVEMLEEAEYLLPSDLLVRLWLAQAYAGLDRREEALAASRSVLAWSHENSEAAKIASQIVTEMQSSTESAAVQ
ncbi:MAG: DUF1570 domain-containing protein [Gammaproteobacteria bacterium]